MDPDNSPFCRCMEGTKACGTSNCCEKNLICQDGACVDPPANSEATPALQASDSTVPAGVAVASGGGGGSSTAAARGGSAATGAVAAGGGGGGTAQGESCTSAEDCLDPPVFTCMPETRTCCHNQTICGSNKAAKRICCEHPLQVRGRIQGFKIGLR